MPAFGTQHGCCQPCAQFFKYVPLAVEAARQVPEVGFDHLVSFAMSGQMALLLAVCQFVGYPEDSHFASTEKTDTL